jgi:DNA mismatch endonuclease (patch repair protein)
MADVHDKETRSYNMSQIKGKNTKPEILVRKFLFANGFRYKLHDNKLPGKPDIVLPKFKTVIMVHGCFWHGHSNCKYFTLPTTRTAFWKKKIEGNKASDIKNKQKLRKMGWRVIEIYQCRLRNKKEVDTLEKLKNKMTSSIN